MKKFFSLVLAITIISAFSFPKAAAADETVELGINAINVNGMEGHSVIYTSRWANIIGTGDTSFSWWKTVTFEYNDESEAYIITSISSKVNGYTGKNNYIPENGFVLCVNIGNDYSSNGGINYINQLSTDTYNNISKLRVGMKAYLVGADLDENKIDISSGQHYSSSFVSDAMIVAGEKPEGTVYKPGQEEEQLGSVELDNNEIEFVENGSDYTVSWNAVENAEGYIININNSLYAPDGKILVNNKEQTETSYTISADLLETGNKYMISICAYAEGYRNSYNTKKEILAVSDRAKESPFRGKKIVAFGDSITEIQAWTGILYSELGTEVVNSGTAGDSTAHALTRVDEKVIAFNPDIVFILFGMNDQAIQLNYGNVPIVSVSDYENNYRTIIDKCIDIGAEVILMTGNNVCNDAGYYQPGGYNLDYGTGNLSNYYDVVRKLASEYGFNLIDMNKKCENEKDSDICAAGDGVHLSQYGDKMFAKWISDFMYDEYVPYVNISDESLEESLGVVSTESAEESTGAEPDSYGQTIIIVVSIAIIALLTFLAFTKPKKKDV